MHVDMPMPVTQLLVLKAKISSSNFVERIVRHVKTVLMA